MERATGLEPATYSLGSCKRMFYINELLVFDTNLPHDIFEFRSPVFYNASTGSPL